MDSEQIRYAVVITLRNRDGLAFNIHLRLYQPLLPLAKRLHVGRIDEIGPVAPYKAPALRHRFYLLHGVAQEIILEPLAFQIMDADVILLSSNIDHRG